MTTIRSPLGALGALMVLMQGISVGALAVVKDQLVLQYVLVSIIGLVLITVTGLVCYLILHFAKSNPGLLFNPRDITPEIHRDLYVQREKLSAEVVPK